ncbi:adenylosuccinate synthetase isozyme 1-like [Xenia sp. Carnegie-2017]|uniref:adenylosuccinate synthetase isozyme 1-like n=1 Tax=Xenia sp. Carnegie-2017 TaxID=2897299 RepID=UPI001F03DCC9|nr:adenylosuccinate synthetase isozyme 1-like [Xenia sp. Carnegie-2017]
MEALNGHVCQHNVNDKLGKVTVVLGTQWGDEGKGKVVDLLSSNADVVCRYQGGNNAGHTVCDGLTTFYFHLTPSGIIHKNCKSILGNGVVIHIQQLFNEIEENVKKGLTGWENRLLISDRAHIVFDFHQQVDGIQEDYHRKTSLGTTKKGIGPTYAAKASRSGIRICDLTSDFEYFKERFQSLVMQYKRAYPSLEVNIEEEVKKYKKFADKIRPYVCDTVSFMHKALEENKQILIEGANATMLDLDFGTYPFVTSSSCSSGGVCIGLGISPRSIGHVIGVVKAYTTRVGVGVLPTEQINEIGETLQSVGREFGVTTGRKRRCGWLDLVVVRYSNMINGYSSLAVTKLDVLTNLGDLKIAINYKHNGKICSAFPASLKVQNEMEVEYITLPGWTEDIGKVRKYDDLPEAARNYIRMIEKHTGLPVEYVGVGPTRDAMIKLF